MKKFKTESVHNAPLLSPDREQRIINPPYIVSGSPVIAQSHSLLMKVGGLKEILSELNDNDSLRITWFGGSRATEYSFIKFDEPCLDNKECKYDYE